jgi:hypothetical protein
VCQEKHTQRAAAMRGWSRAHRVAQLIRPVGSVPARRVDAAGVSAVAAALGEVVFSSDHHVIASFVTQRAIEGRDPFRNIVAVARHLLVVVLAPKGQGSAGRRAQGRGDVRTLE